MTTRTAPRSQTPLLLATGGALLVSGGAVAALLPQVAVATGSTFEVTNTDDTGVGSLRWAIGEANTTSGEDTITFNPSVTGTIALLTGEIAITEGVTITGPGAGVLTVSGNDASRIFNTSGTGTVAISGLTLSDGRAGNSAAIRTAHTGDFVLEAVTVADNEVTSTWAALYLRNTGKVTISNSSIVDNYSSGSVSAVYTRRNVTEVLISGTTFSGNSGMGSTALLYGGTVTLRNVTMDSNTSRETVTPQSLMWIWSDTGTQILNSTFSNNTGGGTVSRVMALGGGGTTLMANSTVTGNTAMQEAIFLLGSTTATIDQSTVTGNAGPELSVRHTVALTVSGSVISDGTATDIVASNDPVTIDSDHSVLGGSGTGVTVDDLGGTQRDVADLKLGALADNGGLTKTMRPLAGSPLLDAGPVPVATFSGNEFDQRGSGYARVTGGAVDVGAVEVQVATLLSITPPSGPLAGGTAITLSGTGFAPGMTVTIGGVPCVDLVVVSETSATCVTPPGAAPGPVDVVVTRDAPATLALAFTYEPEAVPRFVG